MIKNLYVIGDIQTLLENELTYIHQNVEKNIRKQKRKLVLQRNTPWGQLTNPKTKIGYYFDKYGELLTIGGLTFDFLTLMTLSFGGIMFLTSAYIDNAQLMNSSQNWMKNIAQYVKYPCIATLPFLGLGALKTFVNSKFNEEEKEIEQKTKQVEMRKKRLQNTLDTIQNMYNESKPTFIKDFLESVDLDENTILYNKELIILLSEVSKNPTASNLRILSDYLQGSIPIELSTSRYAASSNFLQSEKVKQITRNY